MPKTFISTAIPEITHVRLYEETVEHVCENHPEIPAQLPSMTFAVEQAIVDPTHVEFSHAGAYVFVNTRAVNKSGDPLRVPVKIVEGTSGRIRTFYFASPSRPPKIVWRKRP